MLLESSRIRIEALLAALGVQEAAKLAVGQDELQVGALVHVVRPHEVKLRAGHHRPLAGQFVLDGGVALVVQLQRLALARRIDDRRIVRDRRAVDDGDA